VVLNAKPSDEKNVADVVEKLDVTKPVLLVNWLRFVGAPVSCEYGKDRLERVVIELTEVVAARSVIKRLSERAFV
jgi:hypothetical protein